MSEDFLNAENVDAYSMRAHLSDPDPHPQYVKNSNEAIGEAIGEYLHDNPLAITGVLGSLEDVELTDPTSGQVLVFNGQKWVNASIGTTGIQDVLIGEESIVVDNVAYLPMASADKYGVVRFATTDEVSKGNSNTVGITPADVRYYLENFKTNMTGAIVINLFGEISNSYAWSISGEDILHFSGEVVELLPGEYTIEFRTFDDRYKVPENRNIRVYGGSIANVVATFTNKFASVTVTYDNTDITWKIRGSETVYISGGTAVIDSSKVVIIDFINNSDDINTPESIRTAVCHGDNLYFDISNLIKPASGKVTVNLMNDNGSMPAERGGWFIEYPDGSLSDVLKSGDSIELLKHEEAYKLHYVEEEDYTTPKTQEIIISSKDQKLNFTANYSFIKHPVYGVRVIRGAESTRLTGVIYDRLDMDKSPKLVEYGTPWNCKLTAHDFRKCLVKNRNVVKYLNTLDSTKDEEGNPVNLDGSEGDVMVEIRPVYFKITQIGKTEDGRPIEDWIISREKFPGSILHPYFHVGRTSFSDDTPYVQYIGAYESVLCDSAGTPYEVASNAGSPHSYSVGDMCRSVKGYKPATSITLDIARNAHRAAGLDSINAMAMRFLALMMFIEYRDFNSQEDSTVSDKHLGCAGNRSDGFVWYNATFSYKLTRKTGRADKFGNGTGEVVYDKTLDYDEDQLSLPDQFITSNGGNVTNKKVVGFTYRGIENPFGHIFKYLDGVIVDTNGYYYSDMPSKYVENATDAAKADSGYTFYRLRWPSGYGFISEFEFTEANPTFFPTALNGSNDKYLPDYSYYYALSRLLIAGMTYTYNGTTVILSRDRAGIAATFINRAGAFSAYGTRSACSIRVG